MGKKFIHEMRDKADDYYNNHEHHVNSLCVKVVSSIQPPIEDLSSPEKWKGEHWRWYLRKYKNAKL